MDSQPELSPAELKAKDEAWNAIVREKWARRILKGAAQPWFSDAQMSIRDDGSLKVDSISHTTIVEPDQTDKDAAEYLRRGEGLGWHAALYSLNSIQFGILMEQFFGSNAELSPQKKKDLAEVVEMERIINARHSSAHDKAVTNLYSPAMAKRNLFRQVISKAADYYAKQVTDLGS